MPVTQHIVIHHPQPRPDRYHCTDVDGDRLPIAPADVNGQPDVHFKTDPQGSSVLLDDLPALLEQPQLIAAAAKNETAGGS